MAKKERRPTWFSLTLDHGELLRSVDKETGYDSIMYAIEYLDTGKVPLIESPLTRGVFNILKKSVDYAFDSYNEAVKNGQIGAEIRRNRTH